MKVLLPKSTEVDVILRLDKFVTLRDYFTNGAIKVAGLWFLCGRIVSLKHHHVLTSVMRVENRSSWPNICGEGHGEGIYGRIA